LRNLIANARKTGIVGTGAKENLLLALEKDKVITNFHVTGDASRKLRDHRIEASRSSRKKGSGATITI